MHQELYSTGLPLSLYLTLAMSENLKFANLFNDQKSKRATEMFKSTEATNKMKLARAIRIDT
jgi:hypothetical protein